MKALKLLPSCKSYIWGGRKLITDFNKTFEGELLAETWELSCHKDGTSIIGSGSFNGKSLSEYINEQGKDILGNNCKRFDEFPILIKLIDAKESLSIQVHPSNEYALKNEGQYGKTEMWYIVDCGKDSSLYYGLSKEVTKDELKNRIENNTLLEVLNEVKVKKGDVFFIDAGTIHAIGKDIVIAEIQQNSNVTYRVYDFGRVGADGKGRELHINKALEVSDLKPVGKIKDFKPHIGECEYFTVDKLDINGDFKCNADSSSFHSLLIIEGEGSLFMEGEELKVVKGDSIFIPANSGEYNLIGRFTVLHTTVGKSFEKYRIGIDLGGTNIKVGIVDESNSIIAKHSVKTLVERNYKDVIRDMGEAVLYTLEKVGIDVDQCISMGIGSPGTIDFKTGSILYSNNFFWENIHIVEELKEYIDIPTYISNDANCAALGEAAAGAAKGCNNVILLTLGTGIGGGVVIDGKIFEGGYAGGAELGHTSLISGGELCTCGRKGCIESYASATALIRDTKRAAIANPNSLINELCDGDVERINGITPFEAAQKGDAVAKEVVDKYIEYLGEAIVNMINIFRPEKVILSGGVCNQGDSLTVPLNEYVKRYCFAGDKSFIAPVIRATLGNDAGIIGAALLK